MCVNATPRRKDISAHLRGATVAVHQSQKGYKAVSKQSVHCCTVRFMTKNSRQSSKVEIKG